jgi:hypothetical protein
MGTVSVFGGRTAERSIRADVVKLTACPPRGAIGTGLLLLVSLFLLAAGGLPDSPDAGRAGGVEAGAFVLDPSIASARG